MKKILSILLIIAVLLGTGVTGATAASGTFTTKSAYTGVNYTHYSDYAGRNIQNCIDVSEHNGAINWYAVKSAGVTNAIIRIGYRGYGQSGSLVEDNYFTENVEGAQKAGINIGFYFYSQAITPAEGAAEAKFAIARVKKYNFTLPIFFDYEFAEVSTGRLDSAWTSGKLNKTQMTNNAVSFCNTIKAAGYQAGVYANPSFLTAVLDSDRFVSNGYTLWLAYYTTSSAYGSYWNNSHHVYDYWQYSSKGHVKGVCGAPGAVWLKATYAGKTGYIRMDNLSFIGANTAVVNNSGGANMRSGKGTSYSLVQKLSNKTKVTINEYPTTNTDVNFYYAKTAFPFSLQAGVKKISVSWAKQATADYYRIYTYNTTTKKYSLLKQTTSTSYVDDNLKDNETKTYLVRWFNSSGTGSAFTKADNKTATTAPAKVDFTSKDIRTTSVNLSWAKVAGASFYSVYSYDTSTKQYKYIGYSKTLSYIAKNLKANTKNTFLVRAFNKNKLGSGYAVSDNKTFRTAPPVPQVTFKRYSNKIDISWKAVEGATYYRVYSYNKSTKKYTALGNTTALTYIHNSLKSNTEYTYLVRAGSSSVAKSDYSLASNKSVKTLLAKPDFKLSVSGNSIKVSWSKVAGVDTYLVLSYDAAQGKYTPIKRTRALSYTLSDLLYNTNYEILVRAYDKANVGNTYSPADNKKITLGPEAPTFNLKAASDSVEISWKAVEGASHYKVYSYDTSLKKYTVLGEVKTLSFKHASLKPNTVHTYLVRAYNSDKIGSAFSTASLKKIRTLPVKPTVKAEATANSVKLSWSKAAGAVQYRVYAYDKALGTYSRIAVTKNLSHTVSSLKAKTQYSFLVRAFNSDNKGNVYTVADNISVTTK